jgi:hypothetical protein
MAYSFRNLKPCALDQVRDPFQRYVIAIGSWTFSAKPSDETHAGRSAPPRGSEAGENGGGSPELGYQSLQSLETLGRASLSSPRVAPAVPLTLLSFSLRFLPDHAYFRPPSPSEISRTCGVFHWQMQAARLADSDPASDPHVIGVSVGFSPPPTSSNSAFAACALKLSSSPGRLSNEC